MAAKFKTQNSKVKTASQNSKVINNTREKYKQALGEFRFNEALAVIWELIGFCDKTVEKERLWETKDKKIINDLLFALRNIAEMLEPFLPETSEKIFKQLKSRKSAPLFPRI